MLAVSFSLCLLTIALSYIGAHLQEGQCSRLSTHEKVAKVGGEVGDEVASIKATAQYLIEEQHRLADLMFDEEVCEAEVVVIVQYVETADDALVGDIAGGVAHHLVKE